MGTERGTCPKTGNVCSHRVLCEENRDEWAEQANAIRNKQASLLGRIDGLMARTMGMTNIYDKYGKMAEARRDRLEAILTINCVGTTCIVEEALGRDEVEEIGKRTIERKDHGR